MSASKSLFDQFEAYVEEGPGNITDPGDGETITVTMQGQVCSMTTTSGSETRILAAPTRPGIDCMVVHDVDGGDFALTVNPTTGTCYGYNQDNESEIAFADAGDYVIFRSVKIGSEYAWRAIAQEGTDASVEEGTFDTVTVTGAISGASVTADTIIARNSTGTSFYGNLSGNVMGAITNVLDTEAGTGITTGAGTVYKSSVLQTGGIIITRILIDLTGLHSTADGDIIGVDGTALFCHIGKITAATMGTLYGGIVECLVAPTGGDPDINIFTSTSGEEVEDTAISGTAGQAAMLNYEGDMAAEVRKGFTATPAANSYLYLVAGHATDADYTAGVLLITLYGYVAT